MVAKLPTPNPSEPANVEPKPKMDNDEIVNTLEGYRLEAEAGRKEGPNGRDEKWGENLDLYWNRFDFSKKAKWQSKEVLPEVPAFVDRFAGALREALSATPDSFYTVKDDTNESGDLAQAVKRATDVWLGRVGRNQMGHIIGFGGVFEEQMKLGALMSTSALVTWKDDVKGGRVSIEGLDPRSVWFDPTGRNLYRVRRSEIDLHDLKRLVAMKDGGGKSIYNLEELEQLTATILEDQKREREALTGHGSDVSTPRKPIVLHEYLATLVGSDGELIADQGLSIVANNKRLIRGPEKNPFWHGKDFVVASPLIPVPLSPYGRSYMEDFGSLAKTFNALTNLILDATFVSTMKSFAMSPGMLMDPNQVAEGMVPNKIWMLEDGVLPKDFIKEIDLGTLDSASISVWQVLKNELSESASQNEIGIGQFAPNARTSATEVIETQQGAGALVRSIAANVEQLFLNVILDLVWKTGLQHVSKDDEAIKAAMGPDMFDVLIGKRKELIQRNVTFSARGISTLLQKSQKMKTLMFVLQVMSSNEILLKEFLGKVDPGKLVDLILDLTDIDISRLQLSERERLITEITDRSKVAAERAGDESVSDGLSDQVGGVAEQLGVS